MNKKLSLLFVSLLSACGSSKAPFSPSGSGSVPAAIDIDDIIPAGKVTEESFSLFLEKQIEYEKDYLVTVESKGKSLGATDTSTITIYNDNYSHTVGKTTHNNETSKSDVWYHATEDFKFIYYYHDSEVQIANILNRENTFEEFYSGMYSLMPGCLMKYELSRDYIEITSIERKNSILTINLYSDTPISETEKGLSIVFSLTLNKQGYMSKCKETSDTYSVEMDMSFAYGKRKNAPSDIVKLFEDYIKEQNREDFYVEVDKSVAEKNVRVQKTNNENDEVFTRDGCKFDGAFELTTAELVEEEIKTSMIPGFIINGRENAEFLGYKLYFINQSDEDVTIYPTVTFDGGKDFDWLIKISRILMQTQLVGHEVLSNRYFGSEYKPISSFEFQESDPSEIASTFDSPGNDGFCIPYKETQVGGRLVEDSYVIPKHETLQLIFAVYFEGYDTYATSDYFKSGGSIKLSLHISA